MKAIMLKDGTIVSLQDFHSMTKLGILEDNSDDELENIQNPCVKCNIRIEKLHIRKHKIICAGRSSFMRLKNTHPEFLEEKEVFWILKNHIKSNIAKGHRSVMMNIGTKYMIYYDSIYTILKNHLPNLVYTIVSEDDHTIEVCADW